MGEISDDLWGFSCSKNYSLCFWAALMGEMSAALMFCRLSFLTFVFSCMVPALLPEPLWGGFPFTRRCRRMMKGKEIRLSKLGIQLYVETSSFTGHFYLFSFTLLTMPSQLLIIRHTLMVLNICPSKYVLSMHCPNGHMHDILKCKLSSDLFGFKQTFL